MKETLATFFSTALIAFVVVVALLLSGVIGCHRVVEYPEALPCPVLATLPTGELVEIPREPSCPLPGPMPPIIQAASVEIGDVLRADAANLSAAWKWMDDADLTIECLTALPAGEP